jgi:REP element-mobilizing transposase RayT
MYRNSQTRYYGDYIYSVTCNTYKKAPFFRKKEFCDIFLNVLYNTKRLKQFELYAFCLNHDHFHILLRPNESVANISQIMQALKKNISQDINKKIL